MDGKNDKPRLSGEVQYFRLHKKDWERTLDALLEAGCNTVSTYIPWGFHEPVQGQVDLEGRTHPSRDFKGFLKLVEDRKLGFMARPGPYVNGEITGQGHPLWLLDGRPDLLVFGKDGKVLPQGECYFGVPVSYLHPDYLALVKGWYREVCALVKDFPGLKTFQVDNEISYNIMHVSKEKGATYQLDYQPYIVGKGGLFPRFLAEKYRKLDTLEKAWRAKLSSWDDARPPTGPGAGTEGDFVRTVDWLDFKEWSMAEFLRRLMEMAHDLGIRVPFVVNSPLIDDSCSYRFHKHCEDKRWDVLAGLDLYPGAVRPEEIGWMQSMVEFARSTGCERPGGIEICSCEIYFRHHWIQERFDYEALYKLLTAAGLVDLNYYWFADGYNFDGFGCLGSRQIYSAPITRAGEKRYQWFEIQKNNEFLLDHPEIRTMKTRYGVTLTYDELYSQASRFASPFATDWHNDFIHGEANTGSLVDLLGSVNITAQMLHITDDYTKARAPMLVMALYDFCRRGTAAKVKAYVESGGDVVIFGRVPTLTETLEPYPELAAWSGIRPKAVYPTEQRALRTVSVVSYEADTYHFHSKMQTYELTGGATPIATIEGTDLIAGAEVKRGKGRLRVFGCIPLLFMESGRTFITRFLGGPSPDGIYRYERTDGKKSFTTLLNFSDFEKTAQVGSRTVTVKPRTGEYVLWEK